MCIELYLLKKKDKLHTLRAIYPSSQSVIAAAMKILVVVVVPHQLST